MAKRKDTDAKSAAPSGDVVVTAPAPATPISETDSSTSTPAAELPPREPIAAMPTTDLPSIEAPRLAPAPAASVEAAKAETIELPKADMPKVDPLKMERPKVEAAKIEPLKAEPPKLRLAKSDVPKGEGPKLDWIKPLMAEDAPLPPRAATPSSAPLSSASAAAAEKEAPPSNRFALLAASVAIAAGLGAMAGALGASGLGHLAAPPSEAAPAPVAAMPSDDMQALQTSVAQLRNELAALKTSVEIGAKTASGQFAKITERFDRVERAQSEPVAKLGKAVDALERLEKRAEVTPAKEITGSIPSAASQVAPAAAQPVVSGWVLRDVYRGVAYIQGRIGIMEVETGDVIPGVGRIDAIRKQDGRWVVVTTKGLITSPR